MTSLLIIDGASTALEAVQAALHGLGYEIDHLSSARDWNPPGEAGGPAMILVSADLLAAGDRQGFLKLYSELEQPVPVVAWSLDLPRRRLLEILPPEVVLGGLFEGIPTAAEVLLLVSSRFPPKQRGQAVQRLLKLLGSHRDPLRTTTPRGTHDILDFGLPRALVSLAAEGWSGAVTVEPLRGATLRFWFEGGAVVLATDGTTGGLLRQARALGQDRRGAEPEGPFEDIRSELSFLRRIAGLSTRERARLVEWQAAQFLALACADVEGRLHVVDFAEAPCVLEESLDVRSLLLAAASGSPSSILAQAPAQGAWFVLPSLPHGEELDDWPLEGLSGQVRDFLVSNRTTRITVSSVVEGLESAGASSDAILALLVRLGEMGYLRFVGSPFDPAASAEIEELAGMWHKAQQTNHFEFLGLPRAVSKKAVDDAVFKASKRWHPDTLVDKHPRVQALGALLFARIRDASEILGEGDRRQRYVEDIEDGQLGRGGQDPERARILLAKGRLAIKNKRYAEAEKMLGDAAVADPSLVLAPVLAVWASHLGQSGSDAEGIRAMQDLARRPGAPAELWYYLGRMYLQAKNVDRARKCFDRVLKVDPGHTDSQRQLRLLEMRDGGSSGAHKKSLLDRFRRR